MHGSVPLVCLYLPTEHAGHSPTAEPAPEMIPVWPALHTQSSAASEPGSEDEFEGHGLHVSLLLAKDLNVPALHATQLKLSAPN